MADTVDARSFGCRHGSRERGEDRASQVDVGCFWFFPPAAAGAGCVPEGRGPLPRL